MGTVASAITNTIPITQFNRGLAGKIFEDVRRCGAKVVMKNNTAECVLMSPEEYMSLIDEVNDARLMTIVADRMRDFNPDAMLSEETVNNQFGINDNDLLNYEEVELA